MKKCGSAAVVIILIVVIVLACAGGIWYYEAHKNSSALESSSRATIDSSNWKSYISQYNDFQIKYPSTWQVIETSTDYSGGGPTNEPPSAGWTDLVESPDGSSSIVIYSSPNSPGSYYEDISAMEKSQITFAGMTAEQYTFPGGEWISITDSSVNSYGPWTASDGYNNQNLIEVIYGNQSATTTKILSSFEFIHPPIQ